MRCAGMMFVALSDPYQSSPAPVELRPSQRLLLHSGADAHPMVRQVYLNSVVASRPETSLLSSLRLFLVEHFTPLCLRFFRPLFTAQEQNSSPLISSLRSYDLIARLPSILSYTTTPLPIEHLSTWGLSVLYRILSAVAIEKYCIHRSALIDALLAAYRDSRSAVVYHWCHRACHLYMSCLSLQAG